MQKRSQPIGGEELRPQARTTDIVVSELPGEELVYDLKTHKAYCLNETAAAVWNHCDGETTVTGMTRSISRELGTEVSEELIWLALQQLNRSSLLEPGIVWPEKMSRRMVMRKLGTSALAIPIVMVVIAPTAVQAASCFDPNNNANQNPVGCSCQSNNDCQNSCCGFGNICANLGSVALGNPCRVNCECMSGLTCKGSPQTCLP